jgi:hypothetical protein
MQAPRKTPSLLIKAGEYLPSFFFSTSKNAPVIED